MRKQIFHTVFLASLIAVLSVSAIAQNKTPKLADLAGMAGCWEQRNDAKKLLISEQWMSPAGTSILGMNRTVKNAKSVSYEVMRIEERADGIFFVSRPKENKEDTDFKLIKSTPTEFTFEAKDHDFPQRVIYKIEKDKLVGRIEGDNNGKFLAIDFPFKRVNCG